MDEFEAYLNELKRRKKILRITLLGDGAVGKTSIVHSILELVNQEMVIEGEVERTPFMNLESWKSDGFAIQTYDIAGQRREDAHPIDLLPKQVFGSLDLILLVFSLHRYQSFENLDNWIQLVNQKVSEIDTEYPKFILVGNKTDKTHRVEDGLINPVMDGNEHIHSYVETSAVTGDGIEALLNAIIEIGQTKLEDTS